MAEKSPEISINSAKAAFLFKGAGNDMKFVDATKDKVDDYASWFFFIFGYKARFTTFPIPIYCDEGLLEALMINPMLTRAMFVLPADGKKLSVESFQIIGMNIAYNWVKNMPGTMLLDATKDAYNQFVEYSKGRGGLIITSDPAKKVAGFCRMFFDDAQRIWQFDQVAVKTKPDEMNNAMLPVKFGELHVPGLWMQFHQEMGYPLFLYLKHRKVHEESADFLLCHYLSSIATIDGSSDPIRVNEIKGFSTLSELLFRCNYSYPGHANRLRAAYIKQCSGPLLSDARESFLFHLANRDEWAPGIEFSYLNDGPKFDGEGLITFVVDLFFLCVSSAKGSINKPIPDESIHLGEIYDYMMYALMFGDLQCIRQVIEQLTRRAKKLPSNYKYKASPGGKGNAITVQKRGWNAKFVKYDKTFLSKKFANGKQSNNDQGRNRTRSGSRRRSNSVGAEKFNKSKNGFSNDSDVKKDSKKKDVQTNDARGRGDENKNGDVATKKKRRARSKSTGKKNQEKGGRVAPKTYFN